MSDTGSKGLEFDSYCWSCVEVSGKLHISHCLGPLSRNRFMVPRSKVGSIVAGFCRRALPADIYMAGRLSYIYAQILKLAPFHGVYNVTNTTSKGPFKFLMLQNSCAVQQKHTWDPIGESNFSVIKQSGGIYVMVKNGLIVCFVKEKVHARNR